MNKSAMVLVAVAAICSLAAGAETCPADGAVVSVLTDGQKRHLDRPVDDRTNCFNRVDYRKRLPLDVGWHPREVEFSWDGNASNDYAVIVRRETDGREFFRGAVKGTALRLDNFEVACGYSWSVSGADVRVSARFTTEDRAPRFLRVEGVPNFRDLGGRRGMGGRRIRQNRIFRSAGLNENASGSTAGRTRITEANRDYLLSTLGIRSDIDLRSDKECFGMTGSPLGPSVTWYHYPSSAYGGLADEKGRSAFSRVFRVFLDEKNYPITFHCISGQDRTGAVAFILLALLGVEEQEIWLDWESSAFWNANPKWLNYGNFNRLRAVFAAYEGATVNEKVENYVLSLGFSAEEIGRFRSLMLQGALGEPLTVATYNVRFDVDKGDRTWAKRQPRVVEVVRRGGFDLVGFQEVRTDMWAGFTNALPEYAWTDGTRLTNPIAYRPERFACLTNGLWSISEDPPDLKRISWGSSSPRQWRWVLLKERTTGRLLRVFSIHPDWKSAKARAKGMERILTEAKKALTAGEHVILLGDFNNEGLEDVPLRQAREVLRDARQVSTGGHVGPVNTFNDYKDEANCCIDHIFLSPAFKVLQTRTHDERPNGGFPSDHWAFSARIEWNSVALPADKQLVYESIFAPTEVAVQPDDSARDLVQLPDGEIRHYGKKLIGGKVRRVYIASRDLGLNWELRIAPTNEPPLRPALPWDQLDPRPPLRLRHRPGRIVIACSDVNRTNDCYHATCVWSDDGGKGWRRADVPRTPGVERRSKWDLKPHWFNDGCEPSVAELDDGTLLMALRTSGPHLAFSRSTDGGETWSVPEPDVRFWQANTMPCLLKLRDGRLLMVWNNTEMLPTRDLSEYPELGAGERSGKWETVFTNRDAVHAAISEDDGKTWIGFREVLLNAFRNEVDFRELGNAPDQNHDKSVHQPQLLELPGGKVMLAVGQNVPRRILIFDIRWLYAKGRETDFRQGIGDLSSFLYVRSRSGGWRGWAGHCAWNRMPGPAMVKDPFEPTSPRELLQICRIDDPRLVSSRQGVVWNFPAARKGAVEIECRIEGAGLRASLLDHWVNPCDERSDQVAVKTVRITRESHGAGWQKVRLGWDLPEGRQVSYLHLQTLADGPDPKGAYLRSLRAE